MVFVIKACTWQCVISLDVGNPGEWTEWGNWTECSKTCGPGLQQRVRECIPMYPVLGPGDCGDRPDSMSRLCDNGPCPPGKELLSSVSLLFWELTEVPSVEFWIIYSDIFQENVVENIVIKISWLLSGLPWCHKSIIASQRTANSTVYSTSCSSWQQRKHQNSTLQAICEGNLSVTSGFPS